ncbi:MAG: nodulation protein NfeD [Acidobacteriota bacterium]|nr:nodulation protein NfeD [Acidobacteriota bacterium]
MRRRLPIALFLLSALLAGFETIALAAEDDATIVRVYRHDGPIYGVPAMLLERALSRAAEDEVDLFLLELDTPGGELVSMRDMVEEILNSPVPICVYVTPRGAWAASAGFFLLLSADIAAMAPLTTTGAASPISSIGENKGDDIPFRKASEDASALIRAAARHRGRPVELAEKAVTEAKSWSSEEALEAGLIDLIAESREDLLARLNGREIVRGDGSKLVLRLDEPQIALHELDWREEFRKFMFHPAVMGLLLSIAMIGLYVEFTNPGLILPGVVGVICLLVFFYGSQWLPLNFFALALIGVGLVLFFLEIKVASYGMLSLAGAVCLGVGMYLVFPRTIPGLAIPMNSLIPILVFTIASIGGATFLVARSMRNRVTTGREGVVGLTGRATTDIDPTGTVFVRGEYWTARAGSRIGQGDQVRVVASHGLTLEVEPASSPAGAGAADKARR